jgi:hypothetical protein
MSLVKSMSIAIAALSFGACRSAPEPTAARASDALSSELHGAARGRAIAEPAQGDWHFAVELQGARPGRYAVLLAPAVACPWDAGGASIDARTGNPGVATGAGTGAGGLSGADVPIGTARDLSAVGEPKLETWIGEILVGGDGRGVLDAIVSRKTARIDRSVLEANTLLVRDGGAATVAREDLTTGLIACGRFTAGTQGPTPELRPLPSGWARRDEVSSTPRTEGTVL